MVRALLAQDAVSHEEPYDCHMKNRPPVLAEDRFDPTAVIADRLMVGTAQVIGTHLEGVVLPIGFDTESFYSSVLAGP